MKKNIKMFLVFTTALLMLGCGKTEAPIPDTTNASEEPIQVQSTEDSTKEITSSVEITMQEPTVSKEELYADAGLKDLCEDYFSLGVGINGSTLENQTLNIPEYMELSKKHFNSCTMTNLMKSCYILDQKSSIENLENGNEEPGLNFTTIDPTLQWCMENGMKMRGHTLVWHTQAPNWFFREGYLDTGAYVDKETMLLRMESYIRQMLIHVQDNYPGVIYCWDVVNEAVDPDSAAPDSNFLCRTKNGDETNPWYDTIGEDYVEYAFIFARKYADPQVKLFYNDFNTFQAAKRDAIYRLCQGLKEKGLIDGIGMQGYWSTTYPDISSIETAIKKFAQLDVEIQITELSVSIDEETPEQFEKQAKRYRSIFIMLHNLDTAFGGPANITNVTLFGLVDHYREGDTTTTRIFDKNYEPKPSYDSIREVMIKAYTPEP